MGPWQLYTSNVNVFMPGLTGAENGSGGARKASGLVHDCGVAPAIVPLTRATAWLSASMSPDSVAETAFGGTVNLTRIVEESANRLGVALTHGWCRSAGPSRGMARRCLRPGA